MAMTKERLSEWLKDIRRGDLYCPFEQCTWTFFTSFELADHLLEDCEFGRYGGNVPCTHCNEALTAEDLKYHWRISHKDEVSILATLDRGIPTSCPNYLCTKPFTGGFEGCKEYLKHSIMCHPLYLCQKCNGEYKSKLILHQHQCKGEVKREVVKSISKAEARVDRDPTKRPLLTEEEEEKLLQEWRRAIKSANFVCPVPSCNKQYFFPNHFIQHLTLESKLDSIFRRIDIVECPYCTSITNWLLFGRHLNDYHRDIMKILTILRNGNDITCPNYKCKRSFTVNSGIQYLQHAINCRPLYQCKVCGIETKRKNYFQKHMIVCKGGLKGKHKLLKMEPVDLSPPPSFPPSFSPSSLSVDSFTQKPDTKKTIHTGHAKKNIQNKLKKITFGRQIRTNSKVQKHMPLRKRDPYKHAESKSKKKIDSKEVVINKKFSDRKNITTKVPEVSLSNTSLELDVDDNDADDSLTSVRCSESSPPTVESSHSLSHKAFLHDAIKKKVLKSMSVSSTVCGEVESEGIAEQQKKRESSLTKWKSKISKGVFSCGNVKCCEAFTVPKDMIHHMENCDIDVANEYILTHDKVDCLWCEQEISIKNFQDHSEKKHSMIMEVLQGKTGNYKCQNYDCNIICDTAPDILLHSVECPTCIVCVDCKLTFTSEDEHTDHACMANDEMFRKSSLNIWHNQIKSGHLQCPNASCLTKFFHCDQFLKHLKSCATKSRFCKFALDENIIPCSHCSAKLRVDNYLDHYQEEHAEISKELEKFKSEENIKCISYKCKRKFNDAIKYFHHLTICKPMYLCSTCEKEFNGYKAYMSHPCMLSVEKDGEEAVENVPEEWYQYIKDAIYICPNKECEKPFKTFEGLIPHLHTCKKGKNCEEVLLKDVFGCCICKEDCSLDGFIDHFERKHVVIMNQLLKMQNTSSMRCSHKSCKKVFIDRGKLLQHYIECSKKPACSNCGKNCSSYVSCRIKRNRTQQSSKFSLNKWHEEIKKGNLCCPNCHVVFVELGHFIHHMRSCVTDKFASKAILAPMPCLICKKYFSATHLLEHFRETHTVVFAQLKLIEQGVCIHCPNNGCKEPFTQRGFYLQHVAEVCQLNIPCEQCSDYFKSKELLDAHQCFGKGDSGTENESTWDDLNHWYGKIMKGDLCCPNSKCLVDFVLPRNFVDHIRTCTEGDGCAAVLNRKELPCCFCKIYVTLGRYCSHLASCHKKSANNKADVAISVPVKITINEINEIPDDAGESSKSPTSSHPPLKSKSKESDKSDVLCMQKNDHVLMTGIQDVPEKIIPVGAVPDLVEAISPVLIKSGRKKKRGRVKKSSLLLSTRSSEKEPLVTEGVSPVVTLSAISHIVSISSTSVSSTYSKSSASKTANTSIVTATLGVSTSSSAEEEITQETVNSISKKRGVRPTRSSKDEESDTNTSTKNKALSSTMNDSIEDTECKLQSNKSKYEDLEPGSGHTIGVKKISRKGTKKFGKLLSSSGKKKKSLKEEIEVDKTFTFGSRINLDTSEETTELIDTCMPISDMLKDFVCSPTGSFTGKKGSAETLCSFPSDVIQPSDFIENSISCEEGNTKLKASDDIDFSKVPVDDTCTSDKEIAQDTDSVVNDKSIPRTKFLTPKEKNCKSKEPAVLDISATPVSLTELLLSSTPIPHPDRGHTERTYMDTPVMSVKTSPMVPDSSGSVLDSLTSTPAAATADRTFTSEKHIKHLVKSLLKKQKRKSKHLKKVGPLPMPAWTVTEIPIKQKSNNKMISATESLTKPVSSENTNSSNIFTERFTISKESSETAKAVQIIPHISNKHDFQIPKPSNEIANIQQTAIETSKTSAELLDIQKSPVEVTLVEGDFIKTSEIITHTSGEISQQLDDSTIVITSQLADVPAESSELRDTHVKQSKVRDISVEQSKLKDIPVKQSKLKNIPVEESNLKDTPVEESILKDTPVEESNLKDTPVEESKLKDTSVEESKLKDTPVKQSNIKGTPVKQSNIKGTPVKQSNIEGTPVKHSNLKGTPVKQSNLKVTPVKHSNLKGTPVKQSKLKDDSVEQSMVKDIPVEPLKMKDPLDQHSRLKYTSVEQLKVKVTPVKQSKLKDSPVEQSKLKDASVVQSMVEDTPVETSRLLNTSVKVAMLQDSTIEAVKLQDETSEINNTTAEIQNTTSEMPELLDTAIEISKLPNINKLPTISSKIPGIAVETSAVTQLSVEMSKARDDDLNSMKSPGSVSKTSNILDVHVEMTEVHTDSVQMLEIKDTADQMSKLKDLSLKIQTSPVETSKIQDFSVQQSKSTSTSGETSISAFELRDTPTQKPVMKNTPSVMLRHPRFRMQKKCFEESKLKQSPIKTSELQDFPVERPALQDSPAETSVLQETGAQTPKLHSVMVDLSSEISPATIVTIAETKNNLGEEQKIVVVPEELEIEKSLAEAKEIVTFPDKSEVHKNLGDRPEIVGVPEETLKDQHIEDDTCNLQGKQIEADYSDAVKKDVEEKVEVLPCGDDLVKTDFARKREGSHKDDTNEGIRLSSDNKNDGLDVGVSSSENEKLKVNMQVGISKKSCNEKTKMDNILGKPEVNEKMKMKNCQVEQDKLENRLNETETDDEEKISERIKNSSILRSRSKKLKPKVKFRLDDDKSGSSQDSSSEMTPKRNFRFASRNLSNLGKQLHSGERKFKRKDRFVPALSNEKKKYSLRSSSGDEDSDGRKDGMGVPMGSSIRTDTDKADKDEKSTALPKERFLGVLELSSKKYTTDDTKRFSKRLRRTSSGGDVNVSCDVVGEKKFDPSLISMSDSASTIGTEEKNEFPSDTGSTAGLALTDVSLNIMDESFECKPSQSAVCEKSEPVVVSEQQNLIMAGTPIVKTEDDIVLKLEVDTHVTGRQNKVKQFDDNKNHIPYVPAASEKDNDDMSDEDTVKNEEHSPNKEDTIKISSQDVEVVSDFAGSNIQHEPTGLSPKVVHPHTEADEKTEITKITCQSSSEVDEGTEISGGKPLPSGLPKAAFGTTGPLSDVEVDKITKATSAKTIQSCSPIPVLIAAGPSPDEKMTEPDFVDEYLFKAEEKLLPADIKEVLRSQILGDSLVDLNEDSQKRTEEDEVASVLLHSKDQLAEGNSGIVDDKCDNNLYIENHQITSADEAGEEVNKAKVSEERRSDHADKKDIPVPCDDQDAHKSSGDVNIAEITSGDEMKTGQVLSQVKGDLHPVSTGNDDFAPSIPSVHKSLEAIHDPQVRDDISSDGMSCGGSVHSESTNHDVHETLAQDVPSNTVKDKPDNTESNQKGYPDKLFDTDDSQEEDRTCVRKVNDWLDVKVNDVSSNDKKLSEAPSISMVESLFSIAHLDNKSFVADEIESFKTPQPVQNIKDMSDKENIEKELVDIQSSILEKKASPLSYGKEGKKELPVRKSTQGCEETPSCVEGIQATSSKQAKAESKPGVNISRRFKYGNLSLNKMKAKDGIPKAVPKRSSKLSGIKVNVAQVPEISKPVDADILTLMSYNREKQSKENKQSDNDIKQPISSSSKLPGPADTLNQLFQLTTDPNQGTLDKNNKLFQLPDPNQGTLDKNNKLFQLPDPNQGALDKNNKLFQLPDLTQGTLDKNNKLFELPDPTQGAQDEKNKENFIDFKIEPSDYFPSETTGTERDTSLENEPVVITYDSQEEPDKSVGEKWKSNLIQRQRHLSCSFADTEDSGSEIASPIYRPPKVNVPGQPLGSPLKEMLFLIPKDTYDVQESHGESDPGTPSQLPELSKIRMKKSALHHKENHSPICVQKFSNLSQLEETQVIENELQDLLSTLPTKSRNSVCDVEAWKDKLFCYDMVCYFTNCDETFYDPVTLIEHIGTCVKGSKSKKTIWKSTERTTCVCPECHRSFPVNMFGAHFEEKHSVLLSILKELGENKKVNCKNFRCKVVPTTASDAVYHFRQCGVAVKDKYRISCDKCGSLFKSRRAILHHTCTEDIQEKVDAADVDVRPDGRMTSSDSIYSSRITHTDPLTIQTSMSLDAPMEDANDQMRLSNLLTVISNSNLTTSSLNALGGKDIHESNAHTEDDLKEKGTVENLKILQDICENILTKSGNAVINTDVMTDETTEILTSLEDINKSINNNDTSKIDAHSTISPSKRKKVKKIKRNSHNADTVPDKTSEILASLEELNKIINNDVTSELGSHSIISPSRRKKKKKEKTNLPTSDTATDEASEILTSLEKSIYNDDFSELDTLSAISSSKRKKKKKEKSNLHTSDTATEETSEILTSLEELHKIVNSVATSESDSHSTSPSRRKKTKKAKTNLNTSESVTDETSEILKSLEDLNKSIFNNETPELDTLSTASLSKKKKKKKKTNLHTSDIDSMRNEDALSRSSSSVSVLTKSISSAELTNENKSKENIGDTTSETMDTTSKSISTPDNISTPELTNENKSKENIGDTTIETMYTTSNSIATADSISTLELTNDNKSKENIDETTSETMDKNKKVLKKRSYKTLEIPTEPHGTKKKYVPSEPGTYNITRSSKKLKFSDLSEHIRGDDHIDNTVSSKSSQVDEHESVENMEAGVTLSVVSSCDTVVPNMSEVKKEKKKKAKKTNVDNVEKQSGDNLHKKEVRSRKRPRKVSEGGQTDESMFNEPDASGSKKDTNSKLGIADTLDDSVSTNVTMPLDSENSSLAQGYLHPSLNLDPVGNINEELMSSDFDNLKSTDNLDAVNKKVKSNKNETDVEKNKMKKKSVKKHRLKNLDDLTAAAQVEGDSNNIKTKTTKTRKKRTKKGSVTSSNIAKSPDEKMEELHCEVKYEDQPKQLDQSEVSNMCMETGESSKDDVDWMSFSVWLSEVLKYNFYCPMDHCFKPFYKPDSMVAHVKSCAKNASKYYNMKTKCPECGFYCSVKEFGKHLKSKHILLYWYLAELESGHWVICQNYKCAKYIEDIEECVTHFRQCDYLWKCKYCEIEYLEEKKVERHHCRTSSEEESEHDDQDDNENDNDNKCNKNDNSNDNDRTSNKDVDNNNSPDKGSYTEQTHNERTIFSCDDESSNINENIDTEQVKNNKLKKTVDKITRKKRTKESTDNKKDLKGLEIEKVVKNIKENIDRTGVGLTEDALQEWQENFKKFDYVCPLDSCSFKTYSPTMLCTHMKHCKLIMQEMDVSLVSNQIESSMFICPFDCKKKDISLFVDYIRHVSTNHKQFMGYMKVIELKGEDICLNYKCAGVLTSKEDAEKHYRSCRYLWQCPACFIEYRCDASVKGHSCGKKEKHNIKEEEEKDVGNGKKKRKSAARSSKKENEEVDLKTQINS